MDNKKKVAILVISCDKYSDLWETCSKIFNLYWPDCQYDKFLASNNIPYSNDGFKPILMGNDASWSYGVKTALIQLEKDYDYVFTLLEDYYFIDKIDNDYIIKMFNSFIDVDGNFLRLLKILKYKVFFFNEYFGETENYLPYRQTCVFTLWKIETLKAILKDEENAWEFEKIGVKRGFEFNKFFCVYKNPFRVVNLIIKGKVVPSSFSKIQKILPGISQSRPFFTPYEMLKMNIRDFMIHTFLNYSPKSLRSKIYFQKNK